MLKRAYLFIKETLDYGLDRLIDQVDLILADVSPLSFPRWKLDAHRSARFIGDVAFLIQNYPRLPAYRLENDRWSIIFIGNESGVQRIRRLFQFTETDADDLPQPIARVAMWRVTRQTEEWLDQGADLVIYESSRLHQPKHPRLMAFTVAVWVNQLLTLPDDVNDLLAGKAHATSRKFINRAKRDGLDYSFTQSKEDFDLFYYDMYTPFIQSRHGELALIVPYQEQWEHWFSKGGILFVTEQGKPIAGQLCYIEEGVCFQIAAGILNADLQSLKQRVLMLLNWYNIVWADSQQAKFMQMGGSHGWSSNGPFTTKRRWGAKVIPRRKMFMPWTMVARSLSSEQRAFINEIGLLTEIGGQFYHLTVVEADEVVDIAPLLATAEKIGVDGVAIVKKGEMQIETL